MKIKNLTAILLIVSLAAAITGCSMAQESEATVSAVTSSLVATSITTASTDSNQDNNSESTEDTSASESKSASSDDTDADESDIFTERDLEQSPDLSEAEYIDLQAGEDIVIDTDGVYVLSGDVENTTIIVDADDESKVQLVLDGVNIVNENSPAIYIKSADKVFITSTGKNHIEVSGYYSPDGDTNLDAAVFSKDDLILNGTGSLELVSVKGNGITSKDDLKVTGGEYSISAYLDGLEANDSIRISGGDIDIVSGKDALHCENEEDSSLGYIYILGGTLNIYAADDAIRGNTFVQIDGGTIKIESCTEGIEATAVLINGGDIDIYATDDGINATAKTNGDVYIEVNGGNIKVEVGRGDTDAFDSNGYIVINEGIIDVVATSAFDANQSAQLNGGEVTVNGQVITEIVMQMMGGGKRR